MILLLARMGAEARRVANARFLDRTIARGDAIMLTTRADLVRPNSMLAWELEYLGARGYTVSSSGWSLVPPP